MFTGKFYNLEVRNRELFIYRKNKNYYVINSDREI